MAGHSKWKQIKYQKGAADAKRGQLFTKIAREITVAARVGGVEPEANARLRLAIQRGRLANMPNENIRRAIERAGGLGDEAAYAELVYEGYAAGGVALLVRALTDNRNRTAAEVRAAFARGGGALGESGSVGYLFDHRGVVTVETDDPDAIALTAIDAGADDVVLGEGVVEIVTEPTALHAVQTALEAAGIAIAGAALVMRPKVTVRPEAADTDRAIRLIERLEELDDVQEVFATLDDDALEPPDAPA